MIKQPKSASKFAAAGIAVALAVTSSSTASAIWPWSGNDMDLEASGFVKPPKGPAPEGAYMPGPGMGGQMNMQQMQQMGGPPMGQGMPPMGRGMPPMGAAMPPQHHAMHPGAMHPGGMQPGGMQPGGMPQMRMPPGMIQPKGIPAGGVVPVGFQSGPVSMTQYPAAQNVAVADGGMPPGNHGYQEQSPYGNAQPSTRWYDFARPSKMAGAISKVNPFMRK